MQTHRYHDTCPAQASGAIYLMPERIWDGFGDRSEARVRERCIMIHVPRKRFQVISLMTERIWDGPQELIVSVQEPEHCIL